MEPEKDFRYEIKIPLEGVPIYEIRTWVQLNKFAFRRTFPSRRVNNIYFDTSDLSDFQAHIIGLNERKKIRLRWYGNSFFGNTWFFEIKNKHGNLGWKDIFTLNHVLDINTYSFLKIKNVICNHLPQSISIPFKNYQPVLFNHYEREYFESLIQGVRITIDYNHHSFDQKFSEKPNIIFREPIHDVPIIEIKSSKQKFLEISKILSSFPAASFQFSKYIDGMSSILSR